MSPAATKARSPGSNAVAATQRPLAASRAGTRATLPDARWTVTTALATGAVEAHGRNEHVRQISCPPSSPVKRITGSAGTYVRGYAMAGTENETLPPLTRTSSTLIPSHGRTVNDFDEKWYGTSSPSERARPETTNRYWPDGTDGRVDGKASYASKAAVHFHSCMPARVSATPTTPCGKWRNVGTSPLWSANGSQRPASERRSTRTTGLSTAFEPPRHVNRAASNRLMFFGWTSGAAGPASSGSEPMNSS